MSDLSNTKLKRNLTLLSLIVVLLVAVFSVNLALVTDTMIFAAFYVCTAVACAWLVAAKNPILGLSASFLGWAAALIITKNPLYALLSVSYLPFSLAISFIRKGKLSRITAVGIASASVTVGFTSTVLFVAYKRIGAISLSAIRNAFPFIFKQVSELLYESFFVNVAGDTVSLIAESNVTGYLNVIICLFPAALYALMTVVGFLIAWLYRKLSEITSVASISEEVWQLSPSPVTAVFFGLATLVVAIFDEFDVVTLTAMNMFLLLIPCILMAGLLNSLSPKIVDGVRYSRILRPLTLIIAVINGVVPFVTLCVFYGIFDSFSLALSKRKMKKQN